jgi:hypothetical protein
MTLLGSAFDNTLWASWGARNMSTWPTKCWIHSNLGEDYIRTTMCWTWLYKRSWTSFLWTSHGAEALGSLAAQSQWGLSNSSNSLFLVKSQRYVQCSKRLAAARYMVAQAKSSSNPWHLLWRTDFAAFIDATEFVSRWFCPFPRVGVA